MIAIADSVGLFVIFCCALALRRAAARARRAAVRKFADEIVEMSEKPAEPGQWSRNKLEALLARIRALDKGAFSPLLEQPIVRALLFPIGSLGLTTLQNLPGFLRLQMIPAEASSPRGFRKHVDRDAIHRDKIRWSGFVSEIVVRILLFILLLVAAGAGFVLFGERLGLRENAVVERVEEKIKSAAETALVRGIEKPQCAKLLKHIQDKTGAAVERVSPAGHEVLLTHAGTKSTISLDCTTPARMSLTFISKDTAPSPDWFRTIGDASAALVNASPEAIVAEAKKCLADARRDASTSAGEEESGIDVDCALPEKDERGYLVAVMAADPAAGPAAQPVEKPQTTEKPKPAPAPVSAKRRHK